MPDHIVLEKKAIAINFNWLAKTSYFKNRDFVLDTSNQIMALLEGVNRYVVACDSVPCTKVTDQRYKDGLKEIYQNMMSVNVGVDWYEGFTANEVLYAATRNTYAYMDSSITLVTGSLKLRQLLRNDVVSIKCVMSGKMSNITQSFMEKNWGVSREWFKTYVLLVGDGKGIPGLKGVGPAIAKKIIQECEDKVRNKEFNEGAKNSLQEHEKLTMVFESRNIPEALRVDPARPEETLQLICDRVEIKDMNRVVLRELR